LLKVDKFEKSTSKIQKNFQRAAQSCKRTEI